MSIPSVFLPKELLLWVVWLLQKDTMHRRQSEEDRASLSYEQGAQYKHSSMFGKLSFEPLSSAENRAVSFTNPHLSGSGLEEQINSRENYLGAPKTTLHLPSDSRSQIPFFWPRLLYTFDLVAPHCVISRWICVWLEIMVLGPRRWELNLTQEKLRRTDTQGLSMKTIAHTLKEVFRMNMSHSYGHF